jgi:hypothetical protein
MACYTGIAMTTIGNKTLKAITVPLPHGKKLHLGPGKTGQIAASASEHPPLKKLIEVGEIEIVGDWLESVEGGRGGKARRHFMPGHGSSKVGRRGGDR